MALTTVVAIGGNSLLNPALPPTIQNQFTVTANAMVPIADFIESSDRDDRIVLTHGNGPQAGFKALRSELSKEQLHEVPLDSIVADTQGSIGYMIQRALREELRHRGLPFVVAAVVTEVEVDPEDQAFKEPTKPIGRFYTAEEAGIISRERGWDLVEDAHRGWRRVVPSPAPVRILQLEQIRQLTEWGAIVVACGGGGIPIMRGSDDVLRGVEGVIDKDRSSALLGVRLGARRLVITTAVDGVYRNFRTEGEELLREVRISQLHQLQEEGQFPPGSMGPKVKAADRFLRHGGEEVIICRPEMLVDACRGQAGTRITSG
ncbi:MAG TPA: carbamate kinase [Deltaproteobacteria bacterium]|nr:carbamate kinase [Deltaproteobacteria bacterium]